MFWSLFQPENLHICNNFLLIQDVRSSKYFLLFFLLLRKNYSKWPIFYHFLLLARPKSKRLPFKSLFLGFWITFDWNYVRDVGHSYLTCFLPDFRVASILNRMKRGTEPCFWLWMSDFVIPSSFSTIKCHLFDFPLLLLTELQI